MSDFDLEDFRAYADRHRGRNVRSGPHWPLVMRYPVLFDAYEKTLARAEAVERELAEAKTAYNAEADQFNAGYEAGEVGGMDPFADQPHYEPDYDSWRSGYYAGSYERLTKELAELKERTRWISVGERHPVEELTVLITGGDEVVETGTRYRGDWWQNGRKVKGVTHWQLLPYPPEADHD